MKSADGRLTTLYHYMNNGIGNQASVTNTVDSSKLKETNNA